MIELNIRSEYSSSKLRQKELECLPHLQLEKWLEEAKNIGLSDYNICSIATADLSCQPTVRSVLLRELAEQGMVFYTNRESEKAKHLIANPKGEVLFFWKEIHRQVRARGKVIEISHERSDRYFQSRPLSSQHAAVSSRQSHPIASRKELRKNFKACCDSFPNHVLTPESWIGFQLVPEYWEFWQGRKHRLHDRLAYQRVGQSNNWEIFRLQP